MEAKLGLTILILTSAVWLISCAPPDAEEVERRIAGSAMLQRVDRMCEDLPKPMGFEFVYKSISGNSFTASISFRYSSSLRFSEVYAFYERELPKLGWRLGSESEWINGNVRVRPLSVNFPSVNVSIYCAEVTN